MRSAADVGRFCVSLALFIIVVYNNGEFFYCPWRDLRWFTFDGGVYFEGLRNFGKFDTKRGGKFRLIAVEYFVSVEEDVNMGDFYRKVSYDHCHIDLLKFPILSVELIVDWKKLDQLQRTGEISEQRISRAEISAIKSSRSCKSKGKLFGI
ncbi:hypothetical protein WN51_07134 [Melipona quadrifasciata]|uniref:Uncharacterized protein n=1 Tax=Melipona quadrifasciata TaxID=166423 RepID=A0A0M8ZT20_9HYME|nr:hypothetical protein WN51_07134 [Melipona quadrifasciata]